jgi:uncharacterized protein
MTPQEKDLITQLLTRLANAGGQSKDKEAEALISQAVSRQPDAPYFLVQSVLIQDMALAEAHNRVHELERQLEAARAAPAQPATSFLGNALRGSVPASGPWGRAAPAPAPGPVWTQSDAGQPAMAAAPPMMGQPMPWGAGGGGFLRQAASTAAGVAGGALLFQGIQSLFGPHYGNLLSGMPMQPGLSETVINNNYYGPDDQGAPGLQQADAAPDPGSGQDYVSDQDFSSGQDFSSDQDFGGGGDGGIDV